MKTALATALLLLGSWLAAQTTPAAPQPAPPKPPTAADFPNGFESNPYLVSGGDNPVLGLNVAHHHFFGETLGNFCYGLLFISRDSIRYEVILPEASKHDSFQYARADLVVSRPWKTMLGQHRNATELKFRNGGVYHLSLVRPGTLRNTPVAGDFGAGSEIQDAIQNFDQVVARLAPKPPPAPTPPAITLVEPAGAEESKPVEAGATLKVRGIATQPSGIALVTVNGQPATLKALSPQTSEFLLPALAVASGTSSVLVLATATDKAEAHLVFSVTRPE
ncbi:MAG TPA: hypothetical protein VEG08_12285, partial [Terriglobales bacterium]|nr:hypothetical protein [Terriglobales bacterium]